MSNESKKNMAGLDLCYLFDSGIFGLCKKNTPVDPKLLMVGEFKCDKATLMVNSVEEIAYKETVDFQLQYDDPGVESGTVFGDAEQDSEGPHVFSIESLGTVSTVKLSFVGRDWVVEYAKADPAKKAYFDYSGTYQKVSVE